MHTKDRHWADGIGTLTSYWYVIVRKVLDTQWPEACADKNEALDLAVRAGNQMIGIGTPQDLQRRSDTAGATVRWTRRVE